MKFIIKKNTLISVLSKVIKGIEQNPVLTSLKGVLIKISKTQIVFITSDGNLSIKSKIETNEETRVEKTGEILVSCRLFLELIKKQIGDQIIIERKKNILYITSKNTSITMNLLNENDYPHIDFISEGKNFEIENKDLKNIYNDISFAASIDDNKIILNGINFSIKNNILISSATNSYRLATKKDIVNNNEDINLTIFSKNLKKFILDDKFKGKLKFIIDDQKINLNLDKTIIQSKLMDGEYPKISNFIPTEFKYELKIESQIILNLIERAMITNNTQGNSIKMEIDSNDKKMTISSKKEEIGSTKIEFSNINWTGDSLSINFDSKYMIDAIKPYSGMISMLFNGELKPIIIKSNSKPELTQLVLPQKTY